MAKRLKLITESNYHVEINEDSKKNLYIEGIFASAEQKNENGRVYPRKILEREVEKVTESVKNRTCLGELNHPTDRAETALDKAAILVEKLEWNNNDVHGKAKILSTPYGQIAKNLLEDQVNFGISSRGLGTVNESGYVNEDYALITWDLVQNASNPASKFVNGVLEDKEFTLPNDTTQQIPTYSEIKQFLLDNALPYDPMHVKPLLEQGYELEYIKDMIVMAQDEHVKRIYQVLETLKGE